MRKFVLLLLVLVLALLCACENVRPYAPEDTSGESTDDALSLPPVSLPDVSGSTGTIRIAASDSTPFAVSEGAAGTVAAALKKRDALLESGYGMAIQTVYYNEDELTGELAEQMLAGLDGADLICFSSRMTASLMAQGRLADLASLDGVDLGASYIDGETAADGALGGSVYMLFDDSLLCRDSTSCVFYNRALVRDAGLTDPAVLYLNEKWFWETFYQYSRSIAAVLLDKGSTDVASDTFGFGGLDEQRVLASLWTSGGGRMLSKADSQRVALYDTLVSQTADTAVLYTLFSDRSRFPGYGSDADEAFLAGRVGFMITDLGYIRALYDSEVDWCLVPMPGRDRTRTASLGYTGDDTLCLSVPAGAAADAGAKLSAFLAASDSALADTERESLVSLYSPDNTITVMIGKVLESSSVSFDMIYSGCYKAFESAIQTPLFEAIRDGKALADGVDAARTQFEEFVSATFGAPEESDESDNNS